MIEGLTQIIMSYTIVIFRQKRSIQITLDWIQEATTIIHNNCVTLHIIQNNWRTRIFLQNNGTFQNSLHGESFNIKTIEAYMLVFWTSKQLSLQWSLIAVGLLKLVSMFWLLLRVVGDMAIVFSSIFEANSNARDGPNPLFVAQDSKLSADLWLFLCFE